MTLPAVPMPVHTAYAVPIGNSCIALDKKKKLKLKLVISARNESVFLRSLAIFIEKTPATSPNPARIRNTQAMIIMLLLSA